MPKVSVIIPTYNRAEYLKKSIGSVLEQTFKDFEVLIIDDGSSDNTEQVVNNFSDKRVKYFKNEVNKGIQFVRNTGIKHSSGEYVAYLDDDDEWTSINKLEKQIELFEESPPDVGIIYTGYYAIDAKTGIKLKEYMPQYRGNVLKEFLIKRFLMTSSLVFRKSCFDTVGLYNEQLPFGEDYDMSIRILKLYKVDYVNELMAKYRIHKHKLSADNDMIAQGLSTNHEATIQGLTIILNKYKDLLASNRRAFADLFFYLGISYCYTKETKQGSRAILKAIYLYPFDLRYYYNFTLSLLGEKSFKKIKEMKRRIQGTVN